MKNVRFTKLAAVLVTANENTRWRDAVTTNTHRVFSSKKAHQNYRMYVCESGTNTGTQQFYSCCQWTIACLKVLNLLCMLCVFRINTISLCVFRCTNLHFKSSHVTKMATLGKYLSTFEIIVSLLCPCPQEQQEVQKVKNKSFDSRL